jgi:hypothetical protein
MDLLKFYTLPYPLEIKWKFSLIFLHNLKFLLRVSEHKIRGNSSVIIGRWIQDLANFIHQLFIF